MTFALMSALIIASIAESVPTCSTHIITTSTSRALTRRPFPTTHGPSSSSSSSLSLLHHDHIYIRHLTVLLLLLHGAVAI